jgi:hypothetical protein
MRKQAAQSLEHLLKDPWGALAQPGAQGDDTVKCMLGMLYALHCAGIVTFEGQGLSEHMMHNKSASPQAPKTAYRPNIQCMWHKDNDMAWRVIRDIEMLEGVFVHWHYTNAQDMIRTSHGHREAPCIGWNVTSRGLCAFVKGAAKPYQLWIGESAQRNKFAPATTIFPSSARGLKNPEDLLSVRILWTTVQNMDLIRRTTHHVWNIVQCAWKEHAKAYMHSHLTLADGAWQLMKHRAARASAFRERLITPSRGWAEALDAVQKRMKRKATSILSSMFFTNRIKDKIQKEAMIRRMITEKQGPYAKCVPIRFDDTKNQVIVIAPASYKLPKGAAIQKDAAHLHAVASIANVYMDARDPKDFRIIAVPLPNDR